MSLRLLVDEDFQDRVLVKLLRAAEHDVITANDALLSGQPDASILNYARANDRIVLTRNGNDFEELHQANPVHSGIFAVYREANVLKSMSFSTIVKAITNLEAVQVPLANQFIVLNHWNY